MTNKELIDQVHEALGRSMSLISRVGARYPGEMMLSHAESVELLKYSRQLDCAATALECNARGIPEPKVG